MPASGAEQLRALAVGAKTLGSTALLNATRAELRAEAQPLIAAMRERARTTLPHTGGLNEWVASQRWTVSTRTGARTAGVRLINQRIGGGQTNDGYVRHPVFGTWLPGQPNQPLPDAAGWATGTAEGRASGVADRMTVVLNAAVSRTLALGNL